MIKRVTRFIHNRLVPREVIDFGSFTLTIDRRDGGGRQYRLPTYWAELVCPIEQDIVERLKPTIYLDVGANYGFTALLQHQKNPQCHIIAVEPSPLLIPFLELNLKTNKCINYKLVNALCSDEITQTSFSLNPTSSQDNRVVGEEGWPSVVVPTVTIDSLMEKVTQQDFVYIKVDVQGFEQVVLRGAHDFLTRSSEWILRLEFAPRWLRHQGADPTEFLRDLVTRYRVAEVPKRTRYKGDSLQAIYKNTLTLEDCASFTNYIQFLAKGDGWCDLMIMPLSQHLNASPPEP